MYKNILLAYDGTREGRAALREGALLARRYGADVFLLAIVPTMPAADAMGSPMLAHDGHDEIFQEGLAKAKELGLSVSGKLVHGDPVEMIRACANKLAVDLVVVGHRKRSLLERWWSGPSHAFLSDNLECSLLIAQSTIDDEALRAALEQPIVQGATPSESDA